MQLQISYKVKNQRTFNISLLLIHICIYKIYKYNKMFVYDLYIQRG
jgi:hypothetical protein